MKCPNCNMEVEDGAKFCVYCGKPLSGKKVCASCGAEIPLEATFCTNCGVKLTKGQGSESLKKRKSTDNKPKKLSKALIAVVAIVIASIGAYITFLKSTPEESILNELYSNYLFGDKSECEDFLENNATPRLLQYLKDGYEYDCEDGRCYAIWYFRTNTQDSADDAEPISKLQNITKLTDGWYRVEYIDMGWIGSTRIKFVERNGKMLMDEVIDEIEEKGLQYDSVKKE